MNAIEQPQSIEQPQLAFAKLHVSGPESPYRRYNHFDQLYSAPDFDSDKQSNSRADGSYGNDAGNGPL